MHTTKKSCSVNEMIDKYTKLDIKNNSEFIEFEIRVLFDDKPVNGISSCIEIKKNIFKLLCKYTSNPLNIQTINFIKNSQNHNKIKEMVFDNAIQNKDKKRFYSKQRVADCIQDIDKQKVKTSISIEKDIEEFYDYDLIRCKQRFRFKVKEWYSDFTFVKTLKKNASIDSIKNVKSTLFLGTTTASIFDSKHCIWEYADSIEVEFEYICADSTDGPIANSSVNSSKNIDVKQLYPILSSINNKHNKVNNKVKSAGITVDNMLPYLVDIVNYKQVSYNKITANKNTLKKILPNAIEINKRQYFEDILPIIDKFYITDKADGIRSIIIINDDIMVYNTEFKNLVNNAFFNIKETVIECEMINDIFYAYDVLKYDGEIVTTKVFADRLTILKMLDNKWDRLIVKQFEKLEVGTYPAQLRQFITYTCPSKEYYVDGVIFTSINHMYSTTKFYKWKDIKDMTIDFLAKKCPTNLLGISPYRNIENKVLYILFSGIRSKEFTKLNLERIKYYNTIFTSYISNEYFPIQFMPSDNPLAYLFWHEDGDMDGKIVELSWACSNWKLHRIRYDRSDDIEKKNYYGNHFKVAELIWCNYSNPLTLDDLTADINNLSDDFYFKKHNSEKYKNIRKFNNMVKFELIQRYANNLTDKSNVIDLCCGKGQDLFKLASMKNIQNALFIDNNDNNLNMVIERKYVFTSNSDKNSLGIYIKNIDLSKDWKDNVELIKSHNPFLQKNKTKLIICNFAIHYFAKSYSTLANLINLVNELLAVNGRFIFTCLNGEKVFDLLRIFPNNCWGNDSKYMIKLLNKKKIFKGGEEIEILLPFSDIMYKEYLVNLASVKRCLEAKKIMEESTANFGDIYMDFYKNTYLKNTKDDDIEDFDDYDLEYIKLLYFSVYYKRAK